MRHGDRSLGHRLLSAALAAGIMVLSSAGGRAEQLGTCEHEGRQSALPAEVSAPSTCDALAQVVQRHVDSGLYIGAVLVARGDDVLLDSGFGFADVEARRENGPDTKFRIGSLTKQFTAAAVLLLEEDGLLGLDDRVSAHLPGTPAAWDGITIFHLLTHTSGIPSFTSLPEFRNGTLSSGSALAAVNLVRDRPVEFLPGQRKNYSNSGFVLLGHLVERITGMSYPEFIRTRLFEPLGMQDSGFDTEYETVPGRASGYVLREGELVAATRRDIGVLNGAGELYSTTHDLLRWARALFGGQVLSEASLVQMTTPYKDDYALGVAVHDRHGQQVIEHFGGVAGFNAHMAYYPEADVTVVVLANVNGGTPADIARELGAALRGG